MQLSHILAIAVFVFTYVLIVLKPKRLNEAHAALIGAALTAILLLEPYQILEALGISTPAMPVPLVTTWNVVIILATLMVISTLLDDHGFFEYCAYRAIHASKNNGERLFLYTFLVVSFISAFMCNLINNIPMTAMMLSILQHPGLTPDMNTAMAYSLVIGSNLGANFTTFGALAGILWLESAKRYGWSTTMTDFLKIGLFVTPVAILASSIVLAVEILLF